MRQMYCVIDFKMSTAVDTDPAQNWIVKLPPSLLLSDPFFFFSFLMVPRACIEVGTTVSRAESLFSTICRT